MKKWLIGMVLVLVAFFVWVPLWLLLSGSLMGAEEMAQNLAPVLKNAEGTAVWPLLPMYPTLKPYVELLLDTPQFFAMFWNSCRQVFPVVLGQVLIGAPGPSPGSGSGGRRPSSRCTSSSCSCPSR